MHNTGAGKAKKETKRRGIGVTWTLFAFLALFTVFVLLIVWVFQVLLLGRFYENAKMKEIRLTASILEDNLENENIESIAYALASDYSISILVYHIDGNDAVEKFSCNPTGRSVIHHMYSQSIKRLYGKAESAGGEYVEKQSLDAFRPSDDVDSISTIYAKIMQNSDGETYFILLNSEMAPVSAVVKTYSFQFKWIAVILLLGALVIAFFMSKFISVPIVKLSRSVNRLAKGDYEEKFDGNGYREIRELSDALNYASSELSKTDALQKELISNISHDLRTPLTMIKGYSEVMRDIPGENTPENAQIVIDETTRLSELVSDMLDISKIRSGARKISPEVFDLTETVRATMCRYEKLTEKDGYHIEFISDKPALIYADRTMMLQVVYNLINNAINYTGDDKKVTVRQQTSDGKVRISVTDTGAGIEPENLQYIWDRYYKVDKVHRRAAVGTGLGLSIVKSVLEAHKATYGVDSTPGKGSTFWFEMSIYSPGDEQSS